MANWSKPGKIRNLNGTQPTKRTMWKGEERIEKVPASGYRKMVNLAGNVVRVVFDASNEKDPRCQQAIVTLDGKQKQGVFFYDECPVGNPYHGDRFTGKKCDKFAKEQGVRKAVEERYRMWAKDAAEKQGQGMLVEPFNEVIVPSEDFCCPHVQDEIDALQAGERRKGAKREQAVKTLAQKDHESNKAFQDAVLSSLSGVNSDG